MNNLSFVAILFFVSNFTYSQIVNIPDTQFKNKILNSTQFVSIATNSSGSYIRVDANQDGEIQQSEANAVYSLNVSSAGITDVTGIRSFTNINTFSATGNQISTADFSGLIFLRNLSLDHNLITSNSLNLSDLHLNGLGLSYNLITSTSQSGLSYVNFLSLQNNQITDLDLSNVLGVWSLKCSNNLITSLDLSGLGVLSTIDCSNNPNLTSINMKNGYFESNFTLSNLPNLQYICADDDELTSVQNKLTQNGYSNCNVNSYCTFNPGGAFYTVQGSTKFDMDNNGCDLSDSLYPNQKFTISNGSTSSDFISNTSGNYSIPVQSGTYTVTPVFENSNYFNISPSSFQVTFPDQTSPIVQDFCVALNGNHIDLEINIIPLTPAVPGFDASYKLIYKNKGNTTQSGTVELSFNDDISDFVNATPAVSNQSIGLLTWNYTDLIPFESREIVFKVNLNSPMETPAINAGSNLGYGSIIFPMITDEQPNDNHSDLKQLAVNSFDPNDKTCSEGAITDATVIGKYVTYVIRFENNGTFPAQNIVVKDMIDTTKFDITTLVPVSSSHLFTTKITENNKVEFIFENINLPFDNANNDGYVAFKIKTKSTLVVGDSFANSAKIYFDYNFPIQTNTATTNIQTLKNQDFEFNNYFSLAPNPVKNELQIDTKKDITISSISIYNTLGQLIFVVTNPEKNIDVSSLKSGNYFIKIISDKGISNTKFIKE